LNFNGHWSQYLIDLKERKLATYSLTGILHHDNAPSHTALSVKQWLVKKQIPNLERPLYLLIWSQATFQEELTALMTEAVSSSETSVNIYQINGATS
jgi:hypothetical protein